MHDMLRVCGAHVKSAKVFAFVTLLMLSGCVSVSAPEQPPLTLEQIVALTKEGKDATAIITAIKESRTTYDVMASQYAKLSRDGVPDAVIDFMQNGQLWMAQRQGRREAYEDMWFSTGPGWGYGGAWAPRGYYAYVNGRPHRRYW